MSQQDQDPPVAASPRRNVAVSDSVPALAAKVAHELNNPLDAVLRFVSLAQRKAKSGNYADLDRHLADAQFGLQRMTEVLRELMDLGRQANDILANAPTSLPITDLIARATRTAAAQAEQKHISLIIKSLLPESLPPPQYDLRVTQILSNLLKNAIEAAPENSPVRLTLAMNKTTENTEYTETISDTVNPSSSVPSVSSVVHNLLITVEDSGPGIPPDLLEKLFTPFLSTKPAGTGHGLGLAISRELALSLNGTLTLANRPSATTGCIATLTLPLPNT